eukprot:Tbor_TRINITY_DN6608_c0_g1::TRINITY_DN6608_c0_g1_i1::g.3101::m.3101
MSNPFLHLYGDKATINSEQPFIGSTIQHSSHVSLRQKNKENVINSGHIPSSDYVNNMKPPNSVKPTTSIAYLSNADILHDMLQKQEQQNGRSYQGDYYQNNNDPALYTESCVLGLKDDEEETSSFTADNDGREVPHLLTQGNLPHHTKRVSNEYYIPVRPNNIISCGLQTGGLSENNNTYEPTHGHISKSIEQYILKLDARFEALIDDHSKQTAALNSSLQTKLRREAAEFLNNILPPTPTNTHEDTVSSAPHPHSSTTKTKTRDDKTTEKSDPKSNTRIIPTPHKDLKDATSIISPNNGDNSYHPSVPPNPNLPHNQKSAPTHIKTFERRGLHTDLMGDSSVCVATSRSTTTLRQRVPRIFAASSSPSKPSPPCPPRRLSGAKRTERSPQQNNQRLLQTSSMESHTPLTYKSAKRWRRKGDANIDGSTSSSPPYRAFSSIEYTKGYKSRK